MSHTGVQATVYVRSGPWAIAASDPCPRKCAAAVQKCSSVTQSATTERLSVDQMKGAFGIFGACVGAGLLLAAVQHGMQLLGAARRGGAGPGKSGSKVEALVEEGADTEALLRSLIASVGRLEREVSELRSGKAGSLSSAGDGHTVQPAWT